MRRYAIILVLGTLAVLALIGVRAYTLDLVNYVVCQAYLQKIPPEIARKPAAEAFDIAMTRSGTSSEARNRYLGQLFALSQKLEKVQRLDRQEAEAVLRQLRSPE